MHMRIIRIAKASSERLTTSALITVICGKSRLELWTHTHVATTEIWRRHNKVLFHLKTLRQSQYERVRDSYWNDLKCLQSEISDSSILKVIDDISSDYKRLSRFSLHFFHALVTCCVLQFWTEYAWSWFMVCEAGWLAIATTSFAREKKITKFPYACIFVQFSKLPRSSLTTVKSRSLRSWRSQSMRSTAARAPF